jgi:hypothetical protein
MRFSLWFLGLSSCYATIVTAAQHVLNTDASQQLATTTHWSDVCRDHGMIEVRDSAAGSPNPASEGSYSFQERPVDPHYLPPGAYNAFEQPISDEEYNKQVEYQERTGLPYYRDRRDEQRRRNNPLSVRYFRDGYGQDEQIEHLTQTSVCLTLRGGKHIQVESISSLCNVFIFSDERCMAGSDNAIPGLEVSSGRFYPGAFSSSRVDRVDELPA